MAGFEGRAGGIAPEQEAKIDGLRILRHHEWSTRFGWLVQGVTRRGPHQDFGRPSSSRHDDDDQEDPWVRLGHATHARFVARCRQVHGARVRVWDKEAPHHDGMLSVADGLVTEAASVLLTVRIADCVPVFAVAPESRCLGLAHAGWRGVGAGVVESLLGAMKSAFRVRAEQIHLHLGPAICGSCYEVGTEVPRTLGLAENLEQVDLRAVIAERAVAAGAVPDRVTRSSLCTRCDGDRLYSFRGGDGQARMCAFLGRLDS